MMSRKVFLIVATVLLSNTFNMVALRAQDSADEAAIRKLVERFFDAFQNKDVEGVMSCWSPRSPMYAHFKGFIQADFAASEETQFVDVAFMRWKISAAQASVRLRFNQRWRDISSKEHRQEDHDENVELVKEGRQWKFWLQREATAHLAERLDAAKTKEERAALLKDERDLVTAELLSTVVVAGVRRASEAKFDGARRLSDISFEIAGTLGGPDAQGDCYWFRAAIFYYRSEYAEALADYRRALQLFQATRNRRKEAITRKGIGEIYQRTKRYGDAIIEFEASAKAMREIGDQEEEGEILYTVGYLYQLTHQYDEAIQSYEASLKIAINLGLSSGEASSRNNLGVCYRLTGRYPEALVQHEASLKLKSVLGDRKGVASSLNNIGNVYQSMGEYEEALTKYKMSLKTSRENGDKNGEAKTLNNIGVIYQLLNKYPDALVQHAESLKIASETGNQAEQIKARGNIGLIYRSTAKYADSFAQFEANLKLTHEIGDKEGEGVARFSIGLTHQLTGNYAAALTQYEAGLRAASEAGDKRGEIATRNGIGEIYRLTSKYAEALAQYEACLKLAREIGDKEAEARALAKTGGVYLAVSKYAEALAQYEAGLKMARAMGDKASVAVLLNNLGVAYTETGRYPEALKCTEESLALGREIGTRSGMATSLNNIGEVYRLLGRYDEALRQYEASLNIKREIGAKAEEATTIVNIGNIYQSTGRYADALTHYEASFVIAREVDDKLGEATAQGNIGLVYHLTGRYAEALRHYESTLVLMRALGHRSGESKALANIGVAHQSTGKYDEALTHLEASLKILIEIGHKEGEAVARGSIGEVHRMMGKYADALTQYDASLAIAREIGNKPREAATHHNRALTYESLGKHVEAVADYEVSLKILQEVGDRFGEAILWTNFADLYRTQKRWRQASDAYHKAISLIEFMRTQTREPSLQTSFFAQHTSAYYGLIESLLELGASRDEIFAASERAKARTLVELMSGGKVNILKSMTDAERQREQELKANFIAASAQLNAAYSGSTPDQLRTDELKQQMNKARDDYAEFRVKLFIAHPELQVQRASYDPAGLAQLSELLFNKKPDLCLLSYLVGDQKTFLMVITKGKTPEVPVNLNIYMLKADKDRALTAVELRDRLNAFRQRISRESGLYRDLARDLYEILLAPAKSELKDRSHVVIIPDGMLNVLPFQALIDDQGKHFIQSHTVSYAPSVTALIQMMKLADKKRKSNANTRSLFAMGRGTFPDQAQYRNLELPKAEEQVKSIARLFGVAALTGDEATKAKAIAGMGAARYVHFATHGELNEVAPMESAIVLGKGAGDDGMLYARELVDMDLQAELVVLSACDTGRGQQVNGEGIVGLTWALFVAGTPTSVVTQWQVRDDSMNRLMLEFYREVRQSTTNRQPPISKAEALRRAELNLMKNENYKHPYHWAPIVLVGDWR